MNADAPLRSEDFDQPWRRLPLVLACALIAWAAMLTAFAHLLEQHAPPLPPPLPIEARIVELPRPAGLQSAAPAAAARPIAAPPRPVPLIKPKPLVHHARKPPKPHPIAAAPPSPFGRLKHAEAAPPAASRGPIGTTAARGSIGGVKEGGGIGAGTGSGGAGLGSDSSGARAMYAPPPAIPDDLRETPFSTVAVARFKVSPEGGVSVSLVKPTPNPRLNQILLDTLRQWKFFPAMKDGAAITSEFDVKIPIAVQ